MTKLDSKISSWGHDGVLQYCQTAMAVPVASDLMNTNQHERKTQMERSRKAGLGLLTLVALALVAAYAIGLTTQGWVFASPTAQTAPNAQSTTPNSQSNATTNLANTQKQ